VNGRDCYEVAEILGHSPTTIESWVHLFNDRVFEGQHDESRPGRSSRISECTVEEIEKDLRKNPGVFGILKIYGMASC
jgi:transposase